MPPTSNNSNCKPKDIRRFESLLDDLKRRFSEYFEQVTKQATKQSINQLTKRPKNQSSEQTVVIVSIATQQLYLLKNQELRAHYPISSAEAGIGNQSGSNQTPLGIHQISEKFGENSPLATIFKGRKNTHTIAKILNTPDSKSQEDNITSRILWLDGLEEGCNKGIDENTNNVDSHSRYIYIHGTDEEGRLGQAASHGCVRMSNLDVIELFDKVEVGCLVVITED